MSINPLADHQRAAIAYRLGRIASEATRASVLAHNGLLDLDALDTQLDYLADDRRRHAAALRGHAAGLRHTDPRLKESA